MATEETYQQNETPLDESSGHLEGCSSLLKNVSDSADTTNTAGVAGATNTENPATQNDTPLSSEIVLDGISDETTAEETPKSSNEREEVLFLKKYCTHLAGGDCNRCTLACPQGAIALTETAVEINKDACTRCGICVGICDAYASKRVTLGDLIERIESIIGMNDPVYFTCNDHLFPGFEPHTNVVVLPCLAAVPPEFWACVLTATKKAYLYCDPMYCNNCPTAGPLAQNLYTHALDTAQTWTGEAFTFSDFIPEKESLINKYAALGQEDDYDRRKMISSFAHEVTDIASGKHRKKNSRAVQEFLERKERMRAEGNIRRENEASLESIAFPDLKEQRLWPRRKLLLKALSNKPSIANSLIQYCSFTEHERCTLCKTCIAQCPTGARSYNKEKQIIETDPKLCVICGICIAECPEDACDYQQINAEELITTEGNEE